VGPQLHRLRTQGPLTTEVAAAGSILRPNAEADPPLVGLTEIRAAADRLRGIATRTPLVQFGSTRAGSPILLKAESLQPVGAFKIRGAYNAISLLTAAERARGVVTHSSGNHAQGVARAARLLGVQAVIVMPNDAPAVKRARVEADGAEIVTVGPASGDREAMANRLVEERGLVLVPPYDDDRVIAGQATLGVEIVEDVEDLAAVLVPIGGGGLASGVASAIKLVRPEVRVIGVEPELAADAAESLASGRIVRWEAERTGRTIADGTRSQAIGRRPFEHLSRRLDAVLTVTEAEIAAAIRLAAEEARLVVEPSGALAPAAARFRTLDAGPGTVVAVVSGGNVDPERYRQLLASPLPD
jgi:threonine dehydratase